MMRRSHSHSHRLAELLDRGHGRIDRQKEYGGPDEEGGMTGRLLALGAVAGFGFLLVHQWPEIQRYLKMRSM